MKPTSTLTPGARADQTLAWNMKLLAHHELQGFGGLGGGMGMQRTRDGRRILKRAQSLAGRYGKSARTLLRESVGEPVAEEIVREAKRLHCDLVVMGTHARRRGGRRVPGNRGARVARDSPIPVLLVPQRKAPHSRS